MKSKKNIYVVSILMMITVSMLPMLAMAQIDPGGGPDVPIDGGLSVLLAAGAAYGVKKYREHKKKQHEGEGEEVK